MLGPPAPFPEKLLASSVNKTGRFSVKVFAQNIKYGGVLCRGVTLDTTPSSMKILVLVTL